MEMVSISKGLSNATVDTMGAHVVDVTLNGESMTRPSRDGSQTHGGIAVLIPYAGRVRHGEYLFEGGKFELPVGADGHAIHGFAKDSRWELQKTQSDSVTLACRLEGQGYPGVILAAITYSITRNRFSTDCSVRNIGRTDVPLVVGFHPYFLGKDWRISTGGAVFSYRLRDSYFPSGKREPYSFDAVSPGSKLDDCFSVEGKIKLRMGSREILINRRGMRYLVIYNGKYAEGDSVAVEPYTALPDAYNNGVGLRVIKPKHEFSCGYNFVVAKSRSDSTSSGDRVA